MLSSVAPVDLRRRAAASGLPSADAPGLRHASTPLDADCAAEVLARVSFCHGSNANHLLPCLRDGRAQLMPTGLLLAQGGAPLGGELEHGGLRVFGVSHDAISGDRLTRAGWARVWGYACLDKAASSEQAALRAVAQAAAAAKEISVSPDCSVDTLQLLAVHAQRARLFAPPDQLAGLALTLGNAREHLRHRCVRRCSRAHTCGAAQANLA